MPFTLHDLAGDPSTQYHRYTLGRLVLWVGNLEMDRLEASNV